MPKAASVFFDEDVSIVVSAILRARGFDATTARDTKRLGLSDLDQLTFASTSGRVLCTHNRIDFENLHKKWLEAARPHSGILLARRRRPEELAARLGHLLNSLSAEDIKNQLLYV